MVGQKDEHMAWLMQSIFSVYMLEKMWATGVILVALLVVGACLGVAPLWAAWIGLGMLIHASGHALRAEKMTRLLLPIHPKCRNIVYRALFVGYLLNTMAPFRVGELVRAHFMGKSLNISRTAVLITIFFERVVDAIFLFCALGALYVSLRDISLLVDMAWVLGVAMAIAGGVILLLMENRLVLAGVEQIARIFNDNIRDQIRFSVWSGIRFLNVVLKSGKHGAWIVYAALSVVMWGFYVVGVTCVIYGCFLKTHPMMQTPGLYNALHASLASLVSSSLPIGPITPRVFGEVFVHLAASFLSGGIVFSIAMVWAAVVMPACLTGIGVLAFWPNTKHSHKQVLDLHLQPLVRDGNNVSADFGAFLNGYFNSSNLVRTLNKIDHQDRSRNLKILTGGSAALTALVQTPDHKIVRKIVPIQHAGKLEAQKNWIDEHRRFSYFPKVLRGERGVDHYVLDILFEAGMEPFFDYIHRSTNEQNMVALGRVLDAMEEAVWTKPVCVDKSSLLHKYLQTKVVGKLADTARMDEIIAMLQEAKTIVINGQEYPSIGESLRQISGNSRVFKDLSVYNECSVHGDLTVDNILMGDSGFLILDPNNENDISDPMLDLGKLYQSLHSGYEFLRTINETRVEFQGERAFVQFAEHRSSQYAALFDYLDGRLKESLPEDRYRAILFHEAVHFCRMLPYRVILNPKTVPAFYAVATRLFAEFLAQYGKPIKIIGQS